MLRLAEVPLGLVDLFHVSTMFRGIKARVEAWSYLLPPVGFANCFGRGLDHPVRRISAWRRLATRTVEDHMTVHGGRCQG